MHRENEFNELDLNHLKEKLEKLQGEFEQQPSISINSDTSLRLPFQKSNLDS